MQDSNYLAPATGDTKGRHNKESHTASTQNLHIKLSAWPLTARGNIALSLEQKVGNSGTESFNLHNFPRVILLHLESGHSKNLDTWKTGNG